MSLALPMFPRLGPPPSLPHTPVQYDYRGISRGCHARPLRN